MSDTLIKVQGVSKKFCRSLKKSLWYGLQDLGNELSGRRHGGAGELRPDEFWAIKDVSFELKRGECLGLIGRNGAGKTTLLRMLNGLIKPDAGRIEMRGRVGALIALGAGFNPILTGRENIYVNASVLGLSKKEIDAKFEEIVEFAELGEFIDAPVQSYSSGMVVRLGFAIASCLEPDILVLDEVLAVGDGGFRAKCYNRVDQLSDNSAVVFVSHFMPHIARICKKTIFLERGETNGIMPTHEGILFYESTFRAKKETVKRSGNGEIVFDSIYINHQYLDFDIITVVKIDYGCQLIIQANLFSSRNSYIVVDITFHSLSGEAIAECNNYVNLHKLQVESGIKTKLEIIVDNLSLNPGSYKVGLLIMSENMLKHYDWLEECCELQVMGKPAIAGQQFLARWQLS
mgnify:CR=1 FL=1